MTEVESGDRIPVACPICSPDRETIHEVLNPGGHVTVRCTECDHVHKQQIEVESEIERKVIVSQGDESFTTRVEIPESETLSLGDEFVVDSEEALLTARITSLEVADETRVDEATADAVQTIWTRAIDNVTVNVTLHPGDGNRDQSRSLTVSVPGDYELTVGETESFGDETFEIEGIQIRADAVGYRFDKFDHEGDSVFAKDVKRVYARDETSDAWSAW